MQFDWEPSWFLNPDVLVHIRRYTWLVMSVVVVWLHQWDRSGVLLGRLVSLIVLDVRWIGHHMWLVHVHFEFWFLGRTVVGPWIFPTNQKVHCSRHFDPTASLGCFPCWWFGCSCQTLILSVLLLLAGLERTHRWLLLQFLYKWPLPAIPGSLVFHVVFSIDSQGGCRRWSLVASSCWLVLPQLWWWCFVFFVFVLSSGYVGCLALSPATIRGESLVVFVNLVF